jgi:hypothetical protein
MRSEPGIARLADVARISSLRSRTPANDGFQRYPGVKRQAAPTSMYLLIKA